MLKELLSTVRRSLDSEEGQLADSPLKLILILGTSLAWLVVMAMVAISLVAPIADRLG